MKKKEQEVIKTTKPIKHAQFIVRGGDYNPIGYKCNGIEEIRRKRNETLEELRTRCRNAVAWPTHDTLHVFIPISQTKPREY